MADLSKRSEKLKRLVAVQRHIERISEHELGATTRHRTEVSDAMEQVIGAIGSMDPVHRQFSQQYAERFGRLTAKEKQLASIQQAQEMRVLKERTKADRLEDNMKEARDREERQDADNSIYDLIELTLAARLVK